MVPEIPDSLKKKLEEADKTKLKELIAKYNPQGLHQVELIVSLAKKE